MDPTYTIDIDGELIPGRGYAASYMICDLDGSLVRRRQLARRFASYSDAMGCALDIAKATAASFHPTGGTIPITTTPPRPGHYAARISASLSAPGGGALESDPSGFHRPA